MIVVLAGGVGGAKFLDGLSRVMSDEELVIVGNTGDDLEFLGLHISPDLDTIMYTLAGLVDEERGWGLKGDTFSFLNMLQLYGSETWFRIGDKDLATHVLRASLLERGLTLSEVMERLCESLEVKQQILPATDDLVRTRIDSDEGLLDFQEYFVKRKFDVNVKNVIFEGSEYARPNLKVLEALRKSRGILFAPSNPIVSIGCMLSIPGLRDAIENSQARRLAISPLIAGKPVRGPADRIMRGLGIDPSVFGLASIYRGLIDTLIIDKADSRLRDRIEGLGIQAIITDILMGSLQSKIGLAELALRTLEV
jgi:LPPG:FO 2-phospho-L-lactate transferase